MSLAFRPRPGEDGLARPALLWAGAAALALAAHAGAALWAMRQQPAPLAEAAAPAMMIELAPEMLSPPEAIEEIAPDMVDAPELPTRGVELAEAAPVVPPPRLDPPPRRDATPPEAPPVPGPPLPQPPLMEAPPLPSEVVGPPVARPPNLRPDQPPEPPKEEPEKAPPASSRAAVRARAIAPPAETAAAPARSVAGAGSISPAKWQSQLAAHLERRKRYPPGARARREEGVAHVSFSVDASGAVRSVRLTRSSGFPDLDAEVLALIRRASPVPAPPPGAPLDITAPVQFRLR